MRTVGILALISVCALVGTAYAEEVPRERIVRANHDFQELVLSHPTGNVSVAIFFTRQMNVREVVEELRSTDLKVKGFRHGDQTVSGGYLLAPGESLDEAMKKYEEAHARFLKKHLANLAGLLDAPPDSSMIPSILSNIREAQDEQQRTQVRGLQIIGLEIQGRAESLAAFGQQHDFVRVIEIAQSRQANIVP